MILEFMSQFDPLVVSWEKIASFILDKITIRQIVLLKAKNDYGATSMNLTSVKCLTKVLEELMNELSKISVNTVEKPSEPPRKAAKIIQPVEVHGPTPKIPIIESQESIFIKQEPPEENEQILSDFTNFPEPSPSTSEVENKNPENVMTKVELEPKDEHQCKESIEIKDELVNLDNSKLTLDYQALSKFSENEESDKPIDEDVDEAPEVLNEEFRKWKQTKQSAYNVKQHIKTVHKGLKDYDCQ